MAEYWKGVERASGARRRYERIRSYEELTEGFDVVGVDQEIALASARLWADLGRVGKALAALDLLIAATALVKKHPLLTLDQRDFGDVPGLEVVDPRALR